MPTAFVSLHTTDGFVIASDGRVRDHENKVLALEAQKLFPIPGRQLVFGIMGISSFSVDSQAGLIDFPSAITERANEIGTKDYSSVSSYALSLCGGAYLPLKRAKQENRLDNDFPEEPRMRVSGRAGYVIAHVFMWGYHHGPCDVQVLFRHENQVLSGLEASQLGVVDPNASWCVCGSKVINDILCDPRDQRFSAYRIAPMTKRGKPTMAEGIEIAKRYVAACDTTEARLLDPTCEGIGGRVQIATITPSQGVRWVEGHEPVAQTWKEQFAGGRKKE